MWSIGFLGALAIVTGTIVTATGPHAGDENAVRFGFALTSVARVHSVSVIALVVALVVVAIRFRSSGASKDDNEAMSALLLTAVLQGAIGYTQYFTGVPVVLVGAHIIGAIGLFLAICNLLVAPRDSLAIDIDGPAY